MSEDQEQTPERVRIKDSYRKRIFAESQYLDKSYLETLYFIIDCYFAFKKGAFPMQHSVPHSPIFPSVSTNESQSQPSEATLSTPQKQEDSGSEIFTLDFDL